jgi:hypothetical protein
MLKRELCGRLSENKENHSDPREATKCVRKILNSTIWRSPEKHRDFASGREAESQPIKCFKHNSFVILSEAKDPH